MRAENLSESNLPEFKEKLNICLISAPYYKDITDDLIKGALNVLKKINADTKIVEVSGALEIPTAIKLMENKFDGFIAIGCVIRGETTHYETVCQESSRGLMDLAIYRNLAIGNGILTVENTEQAWERADINRKDKGGDAARAAMAMAAVAKRYAED